MYSALSSKLCIMTNESQLCVLLAPFFALFVSSLRLIWKVSHKKRLPACMSLSLANNCGIMRWASPTAVWEFGQFGGVRRARFCSPGRPGIRERNSPQPCPRDNSHVIRAERCAAGGPQLALILSDRSRQSRLPLLRDFSYFFPCSPHAEGCDACGGSLTFTRR